VVRAKVSAVALPVLDGAFELARGCADERTAAGTG